MKQQFIDIYMILVILLIGIFFGILVGAAHEHRKMTILCEDNAWQSWLTYARDVEHYNRALQDAIADNNMGAAQLAISNGADVNADFRLNTWFYDRTHLPYIDTNVEHSLQSLAGQAVLHNQPEMLTLLLDHGLLVNGPNNADYYLLDASAKGLVEIVNVLLAHGADINISDPKGHTALFYACRSGQENCARLLLSSNADPYVRVTTNKGDRICAIHTAASHGHLKVVQLLIEYGVSPEILTSKGLTAEQLAVERGHHDIANYLKSVR